METLISRILLSFFISGCALAADSPCSPRVGDAGQGYICVCNSSYCDTVETPERLDQGLFYMYKTSNTTPGFTKTTGGFIKDIVVQDTSEVLFTINSSTEYQEITGFGGAVTDSALLNINYLPQEAQDKLLESYFGPSGIEYSIMRVPIGSTDFSTRMYTLDDVPYDEDLEHFSLADEDYDLRIPFIKKALNVSQRAIKIMGCTWASPSWMKNNNTINAQFISRDHMDVWARYHVRFLEEYQKEDIPFWALSGGNEVMMLMMVEFPTSILNFTLASAPIQRSWLKNNLKPHLRASNFSNIKFMTLEDERLFAPYWMERFANDPEALSEVDGISLHTYSDKLAPTSVLDNLHESYPNISIYYTETSINTGWGSGAVLLGSWDRAETYLSNIFENLNHWAVSYVDWNIALDETGGPSRSYSIDSPVIVNQTGSEFYKQPMFYAMGHFSKFVPPGSKRVQVLSTPSKVSEKNQNKIETEHAKESLKEFVSSLKSQSLGSIKKRSSATTSDIQCMAFSNQDNSTTVLVLNTGDESMKVRVNDPRIGSVSLDIEEHSMNTLIYWV